MRFMLSVLNKLSSSEVNQEFLKIPLHDNVLELIGDFSHSEMFVCPVSHSLHYLPSHVNEVILTGIFCYSVDTINDNLSGQNYRATWRCHVGRQFPLLIHSLPRNINTLKVNLKHDPKQDPDDPLISDVVSDLTKSFASLPPHIDFLDLTGIVSLTDEEHPRIWKLYHAIPNTVQKLFPHQINWKVLTDEHREYLLKASSSGLMVYSLEKQNLFSSASHTYKKFFNALSKDVMGMSLAHCNIGAHAYVYIMQMFKSIGHHIVGMNLKDNNLYILESNLHEFFKSLPPNIAYLDISENNLLSLPTEYFKNLLGQLPKKINTLKIYEKSLDSHPLDLIVENFASLPVNILAVGFAGGQWMGLKINQFVWVLHKLPSNVFCIDYSDSKLHQLSAKEFYTLVTYTPPNITKLVFKRNNLIAFSAEQLRVIFSRIPYRVQEIDISENGFDRLPFSSLNEIIKGLPDIYINFGRDKITRRFDGQLLPFPWRMDDIYFKRIGLIYHQKKLSEYFLTIHQFIKKRKFPDHLTVHILSYLFSDYPKKVLEQMVRKASLYVGHKDKLDAVDFSRKLTKRLETQKHYSTFDISHSGLSYVGATSQFKLLFESIPVKACRINFRCNGIALEESSLTAFTNSLKYLPRHITYIDISGNYFEHLPSELLHGLLINIPSWIQLLSLNTERPISVVDHLSRLEDVPAYFFKLIKNEDNILEKLLILLRDYTQDDSWFRRLIFGYWNRQNIPEIRRLMFIINSHQLIEYSDIMHYLQTISMPNEHGALAKSMSLVFREHQKSLPSPSVTATFAPKTPH